MGGCWAADEISPAEFRGLALQGSHLGLLGQAIRAAAAPGQGAHGEVSTGLTRVLAPQALDLVAHLVAKALDGAPDELDGRDDNVFDEPSGGAEDEGTKEPAQGLLHILLQLLLHGKGDFAWQDGIGSSNGQDGGQDHKGDDPDLVPLVKVAQNEGGNNCKVHLEGRTNLGKLSKCVVTRAVDHEVALVAEWVDETRAGAKHDSNRHGGGLNVELVGDSGGNRVHDCTGGVVGQNL
mmetsp:Transcript_11699/g.25097  ORF Transcript_11699/g.25097 Transcript_11699/m.25097 type:complete len:236 (+) Transcript_11699:1590-2297(+)